MGILDARPIPRRNTAYRLYFPLFDTSGAMVAGAAGLDSEVSLDGAVFADCVNEAVHTGKGIYYLDLEAAEMNADAVVVVVTSTTPDSVPTPILLYPEDTNDIVNLPAVADAVWDELLGGHLIAGSSGVKLSSLAPCAGSGANIFVYTVTDAVTTLPLMGVRVWATTDLAGTNEVALGYTNAFGKVTFYLDSGTWYLWRSLSGYTFVNPDTEVIP